jgi:AsmA protein
VGALVLLALLAVVAITVFVDPNRYRGQIEAAVMRATGEPFRIVGDLQISWYPWLSLRMGPAQFGKKPGSPEPPIVEWQAARVGAKLIPLTQGQLIVDRIRLEGPRFHLIRRADGSSNWDDVITSIKARSRAPTTGPRDAVPGPQIAGFQVRDGALEYVNEATGQRLAISSWLLNVGEWRAGATFPVETQFAYRGEPVPPPQKAAPARAKGKQPPPSPPLEADVKLSGRVHVSDDANDIDVFGLESSNQLRGGPLPPSGVPITLQVSRLAARLTPLDIAISEVAAHVADAELTASIQAGETGPEKALYVRGPLNLQVASVREFLPKIGVKAPLPLDKTTIGTLHLNSMWEWREGAVAVNSIDLQLDDTHFNGELTRAAGDDPLWTFTLHGDKIGLSRYVEIEDTSKEPFELPLATLRALKMQGELTFDQAWLAEAQMKNVRLRLELADGTVKQTK